MLLRNRRCLCAAGVFSLPVTTSIRMPWFSFGVRNHRSTAGITSKLMEPESLIRTLFVSISKNIGSDFPLIPGRTISYTWILCWIFVPSVIGFRLKVNSAAFNISFFGMFDTLKCKRNRWWWRKRSSILLSEINMEKEGRRKNKC